MFLTTLQSRSARPVEPASNASKDEVWEYQKRHEDSTTVQCYMMASMCNELQRNHKDMERRAMLLHLMELFAKQSRTQRYEISKSLFRAQMVDSSSVQAHVLKMIELIERLTLLRVELPIEMRMYLILHSLSNSFSQFIVNFNMNKIQTSLPELFNMLIDKSRPRGR